MIDMPTVLLMSIVAGLLGALTELDSGSIMIPWTLLHN